MKKYILKKIFFKYSKYSGSRPNVAFDMVFIFISKINESINIYPLSKINEYCNKNAIQIGIIAVPTNSAQKVLDVLIENDIKAIWNFAPCKLKYPEDIIFIQENLALSLAHLNNQLNSKLRGKNEIR